MMKSFKDIIFIGSFLFARVPLWFIVVAFFVNSFVTFEQFIMLTLGVIFMKSFIVGELTDTKLTVILMSKFYRFIGFFAFIFFVYFALIYVGFIAGNLDKMLISLALMILVYLYFDKGSTLCIPTYEPPLLSRIILTLLWVYLAFIPDTFFGNISIIVGIYIIEFFYLFQTDMLKSHSPFICKEVEFKNCD